MIRAKWYLPESLNSPSQTHGAEPEPVESLPAEPTEQSRTPESPPVPQPQPARAGPRYSVDANLVQWHRAYQHSVF